MLKGFQATGFQAGAFQEDSVTPTPEVVVYGTIPLILTPPPQRNRRRQREELLLIGMGEE